MSSWKQPPLRPSQIVEFHPYKSRNSHPMLVLEVSDKHICGVAFSHSGAAIPVRECRHVSDPELESRPITREDGTWDYSLDSKEVKRLREELDELRDLVIGQVANEVSIPDAPNLRIPEVEYTKSEAQEAAWAKGLELARQGLDKATIVKATGLHHKTVEKLMREAYAKEVV